ncbi:MAG TPA: hypothetical protein VGT82_16485 [Ktedonobacteraceae bacterium]|nr:hypothetical protein [Ktedonobacteraceae bacterium]
MLSRTSRYLLAALQAILGWEWIMSAANKLASGSFPQGLAGALTDSFKGNPDDWYVVFLKQVVLPNSTFFGYLIEWSELFIGIILIGGALVLLTRPRVAGEPQHGLYVLYSVLVIFAAVAAAFQNINFHFFMGGWILPSIDPSGAYDEAIDLEALLPLLLLVVIVANIALIQAMTGAQLIKQAEHHAVPASTNEG